MVAAWKRALAPTWTRDVSIEVRASSADLKVLAVDDHGGVLHALRCALGPRFACFDTTPTGAEALRSLESESYDAVLLDVMMPELDGITCCKRIREHHPGLAVVMLSAHGNADCKLDALAAGAADYVLKPVSCDELYARIVIRVRERRLMAAGLGSEAPPASESPSAIEIEELSVDCSSRTVWVHGEERKVKPSEFELLEELVVHRGCVVLRSRWRQRPGRVVSDEAVRACMSGLRAAIGPANRLIERRPGGYVIL